MVNINHELKRLWSESRTLTATGVLMLSVLIVFAAGVVLDPRTITGAPAWLKPSKFALSTAIFLFTIAWLLRYITVWRPFLRVISALMAGIFILEVAIVAYQASRGVASHFNAS